MLLLLGEVGKSSRHRSRPGPSPSPQPPAFYELLIQLVGGEVLCCTSSSRHPPRHPFPPEHLRCDVAGREGAHWTLLCWHLWYKDQSPGPGRLGEGRQPISTGVGAPGGLQGPCSSCSPSAGSRGPHAAQQVLKPGFTRLLAETSEAAAPGPS